VLGFRRGFHLGALGSWHIMFTLIALVLERRTSDVTCLFRRGGCLFRLVLIEMVACC
jgi:hypothetical protein